MKLHTNLHANLCEALLSLVTHENYCVSHLLCELWVGPSHFGYLDRIYITHSNCINEPPPMAFARQTPSHVAWFHACQCRVTSLSHGHQPSRNSLLCWLWEALIVVGIISDAVSHGGFNRISYQFERSSNIVELCSSCWKMTIYAPFNIVACKKFSWSGQGEGIAPCPP